MNRRACEADLTATKTEEACESMRQGIPTIEAARPGFCGLTHHSPLVEHMADVWEDRHFAMVLALLRDDAPSAARDKLRDDLAAAIGERVACGLCDDADEMANEFGIAA